MKILMATNTFLPHVGGVAQSVELFRRVLVSRGHQVLVVAPSYPGEAPEDPGVLRVPALQRFAGSDFSVRLPIPGFLFSALRDFRPDVVHSHHPFLIGDLAKRIAARWNVPLIFTHHTMYEDYTHYIRLQHESFRRIAVELVTGYANLCHHVIAPSESVREVLIKRGVVTPITVIPTGVDLADFSPRGTRQDLRRSFGIPDEAEVIGHVGRLALEKNLEFLARALARSLTRRPGAYALIVGDGPWRRELHDYFAERGLSERVVMPGTLQGERLHAAFGVMDVFAFSSLTETQGLVLLQALASGVPVAALSARGTRDLIHTGENGQLILRRDVESFCRGLSAVLDAPRRESELLEQAAMRSAKRWSMDHCAENLEVVYREVRSGWPVAERSSWDAARRVFESQVELLRNSAAAVWRVLSSSVKRARNNMSRLFDWRRPEVASSFGHGLVMVQIDGLSRHELERAIHLNRLPFLRSLLRVEDYRLATFYSGLPSTTPAVQAELFYGVQAIVPAFTFSRSQDVTCS